MIIDDILKSAYSPLADVYDRISKWKQLKDDLAIKTRLLYLECSRNLALLSTVQLDRAGSEIAADDEDYLAVVGGLEIDVLEMLFFEGEESSKFFKLLNAKMDESVDDPGEERQARGRDSTPPTIIQACVALYVSIYTLRKIAQMPRKGIAFRKVNFRTRLRNIRSNFLAIVKMLSRQKEVDAILREKP
ncbi:MAG: hypothetical protein H6695_13345 [Deferribacteres bacterium]|nr:hypothetical protein [candidate division KSB1 bacterium]MCB9511170.1 hypothetical protein [Deferribacteres bacterium]